MNMSNYFDLRQVWVNELVGTPLLFFFVGIIAIWLFAARAKIPFNVTTLLSIVWVGVVFSIEPATFTLFWAIALMLSGLTFYYAIAKPLK